MQIQIITTQQRFFQEICEMIRFFEPKTEITTDPKGGVTLQCDFVESVAFACIKNGGDKIEFFGNKIENYHDPIMQKRIEKREFKIVLYKALSKFFNVQLAWGALTGIRPTKLALSFIKSEGQQKAKQRFKNQFFVTQNKIDLTFNTIENQTKILQSATKKDFDLYVGIPFCPTRCGYCSFGAYEILGFSKTKIDEYLNCLQNEILTTTTAALELGYKIRSVYIGGGTPTSILPNQLEKIIKTIRFATKGFEKELTVEGGRPETLSEQMLSMLIKNATTRISINPQTFNDKTLNMIGRNHTSEQTITAFNLARKIGFNNINMDVILALPDETIHDVENTFKTLLSLDPDSITVHTLAIKRTAKFKYELEKLEFADLSEVEKMIDLSHLYAKKLSMQPYYLYRQKYMQGNLENVGFSKPGKQSIYNVDIMEESTNILACGAGAISKWVYEKGKVLRQPNPIDLKTYFEKQTVLLNKKVEMMTQI